MSAPDETTDQAPDETGSDATTDGRPSGVLRAARRWRGSTPLYPRLLGLRHVHPNGWQRALLGEGALVAGLLLAMADLASAWAVLVLPVAVAAVVKAHDLVQGLLEPTPAHDDGAGPQGEPAPSEASRS